MESAKHDSIITSVPRIRDFQWPPRGSLEYMRTWTFEKGIATFDAYMFMRRRWLDSPALPPKTKLAHILADYEAGNSMVNLGYIPSHRKDTHPPNECFHCGLPWLDTRQLSPEGESSHWFVDIHDCVSRKIAYLFCWKCVEAVKGQLQPSQLGCRRPSLCPCND